MATRIQLTGNYDADGNPETIDPDMGIETKEQFGANKDEVSYGSQVNSQAKYNGRIQFGAEAAEEAANEDAQIRVDAFVAELDRLESVTDAGRMVDNSTLERLQHELNDTAMAYVRMGGGLNDDVLVAVRQRIKAISTSAKNNR